ncbi:MAG: DUF6297 family protein [Angustibacter sp.]
MTTARAPRTAADRIGRPSFESTYTTAFAVGLGVVSVLSVTVHAFSDGVAAGQQRGLGTPLGLAVAAVGALTCVLAALGPVYVTADRARWLVATPLDRFEVVRRSVTGTAAAVAGAGGLGGAVVSLSAPAAAPTLAGTLVATALGSVVALAIHQGLLAAQGTYVERPARRQRFIRLGGAAAIAGALLTAADLRSPEQLGSGLAAGPWVVVLAGGAAVGVAAALALSLRPTGSWCRRLTVAVLRPGGSLVESVTTSVASFDQTALELRSERLRLGHRGAYPSRRVLGPVWADLVCREALAVGRRWRGSAARGAAAVVVWPVGTLFGPSVWVVAAAAVTYLTTAYAAAGLRTWLSSSGLRRGLPQRRSGVTLQLAIVPLVVGCAVAVVALAGSGLAVAWVGVLATAAVAAVVRRGRRPALSMGVVVSTPAGALPLGLVRHLTYGPDLVAVSLVLAAAFGPVLGLIATLTVLTWEVRAGGSA